MMSAFSRGFAMRLRCIRPPPAASPRLFSSSIIFRAQSSKIPASAKGKIGKLAIKNTALATPPPAAYQSYATALATKSSPTLLYEAPSHTLFIVASYTGAAFCLLYAGYNFNAQYINPPPDLATWVPYAFGGVCFLMAALGGYLILGPASMIRRITAVPNKAFPGGLEMKIQLRRMLPIPEFVWPARVISAVPEDLSLSRKLFTPVVEIEKTMSPADRLRWRRIQEEEKKKREEIERSKIMTAPFRHASMAFHSLFKNVARSWSRDGFLKLSVKERAYKLDITGGWVLDQGKSIDRLVKVKQSL